LVKFYIDPSIHVSAAISTLSEVRPLQYEQKLPFNTTENIPRYTNQQHVKKLNKDIYTARQVTMKIGNKCN